MKRILWLVAIAAACHHNATPGAALHPPADQVWVTQKQIHEAAITTDVVAPRAIPTSLTTTGRITFTDTRVAHVFSPVTGRLEALNVELGQFVRRGTPLAVMASPDLGAAAADLQKAEADRSAAKRDYERQKELYEAHAAAQRDFESAEASYRKAEAERERAMQKYALLQGGSDARDRYILRAPIDGEVVARNAGPGTEVQGQYGGGASAELFTIGNIDTVWLIADVFEVDLPRVHLGAPVTVSVLSYPERQFTGRVDWIAGSLDPMMRTAKVRCVIANGDHALRPEMFAAVSIQTSSVSRVSVPRSAVVRLADDMVAYVDLGPAPGGGERFERRAVTVDEADAAQYVPVLAGLSPGERVVSSGALILSGAGS